MFPQEAERLQKVLDKEAARAQKQQDKDVHRWVQGCGVTEVEVRVLVMVGKKLGHGWVQDRQDSDLRFGCWLGRFRVL